jgi:hypothetical protein
VGKLSCEWNAREWEIWGLEPEKRGEEQPQEGCTVWSIDNKNHLLMESDIVVDVMESRRKKLGTETMEVRNS